MIVTINVAVLLALIIVVRLRRRTHARSRPMPSMPDSAKAGSPVAVVTSCVVLRLREPTAPRPAGHTQHTMLESGNGRTTKSARQGPVSAALSARRVP